MHCPRCGHQQNSDEIRFCTKCGLEIGDVKELLAPELRGIKTKRKKAVNKATRQGVTMMVFGFVLITLLAFLREFFPIPETFVIITVLIFCMGGVVRAVLPYLFGGDNTTEEKKDLPEYDLKTNKLPGEQVFVKSLPEAEYRPPINFAGKSYDTNELMPVSSITEVTTKDLEKKFQVK